MYLLSNYHDDFVIRSCRSKQYEFNNENNGGKKNYHYKNIG